MEDQILMNKIKELARKMEHEELLELKLCKWDCQSNIENAKCHVIPKKKYYYIDQGNLTSQQSGKFMIERSGANKGTVWSIKGYGQRGYPRGTVEDQLKITENNIKVLSKAIENKAMAGKFG
jgi:hypothetical protein